MMAFRDTERDEIADFWSWFQQTAFASLAEVNDGSEPIVLDLDERLHHLGLSWELGPAPGDPGAWALAISFGANLQDLPRARMIVERAPSVPGWHVLLGKPPKEWDWRFSLPKSDQVWVDFDASFWRCAVEARTEGRMRLLLSMGSIRPDQEDLVTLAAEVAVEGAIGELVFATQIAEIVVVSDAEVARRNGDPVLLRDLSRRLG